MTREYGEVRRVLEALFRPIKHNTSVYEPLGIPDYAVAVYDLDASTGWYVLRL